MQIIPVKKFTGIIMRKRKSVLKVLVIIFAVMFVINTLMMRILFGINIVGNQILLRAYTAETEPVRTEADTARTGAFHIQAEAKASGSLYALTPDEINSLWNLGLLDKIAAASILSKLSAEEIDLIIGMSADGITFDEYEELKALAENYLDPSDIKVLEKILFSSDT